MEVKEFSPDAQSCLINVAEKDIFTRHVARPTCYSFNTSPSTPPIVNGGAGAAPAAGGNAGAGSPAAPSGGNAGINAGGGDIGIGGIQAPEGNGKNYYTNEQSTGE